MGQCKYEQRGLPSRICPECGQQHFVQPRIQPRHLRAFYTIMNVVAILLPLCVIPLAANDPIGLVWVGGVGFAMAAPSAIGLLMLMMVSRDAPAVQKIAAWMFFVIIGLYAGALLFDRYFA